MSRPVHICAVAARTPLGLSAESSAAAVRAGLCAFKEHARFVTRLGEPVVGAMDARLDSELGGLHRRISLAEAALDELATKLGVESHAEGLDASVLLAMPELVPGWRLEDESALAAQFESHLRRRRVGTKLELAGRGHAGALLALGHAAERVAAGSVESCIVGGVDSYFDMDCLGWLERHEILAGGGGSISGLVPGEAAAFLVVASPDFLRRRKLPSQARLIGWSTTEGPDRRSADPDFCGGELSTAIANAMTLARRRTGAPGLRAESIYCDLNGERFRSEEWTFAMTRAAEFLGDATRCRVATDCWGDVGASTGALLAVLAVRAWARDYAKHSLTLLWSGSYSGLRSAVVLEAPRV